MTTTVFLSQFLPTTLAAGSPRERRLAGAELRIDSPATFAGAVQNAIIHITAAGNGPEVAAAALADVRKALTSPGPGGRDLLAALLLLAAAHEAMTETEAS